MSTVYWPFSRGFDFGSFDLGMRIIVRLVFFRGWNICPFSGGSFHGPFMELCHGIKIWWASTSQVPGSQWKVYNQRDRGISMLEISGVLTQVGKSKPHPSLQTPSTSYPNCQLASWLQHCMSWHTWAMKNSWSASIVLPHN